MILAPSDELELKHMVQTIYEIDTLPTCLRYPRGSALGLDVLNDLFEYGLDEYPARGKALPLGKGRVVRGAREDVSSRVAILSLGTRLAESVLAARAIEHKPSSLAPSVVGADDGGGRVEGSSALHELSQRWAERQPRTDGNQQRQAGRQHHAQTRDPARAPPTPPWSSVTQRGICPRASRSAWTWASAGTFNLQMGFCVDPLGAVMLALVTTIALLVMVYSHGYMAHDKGYVRFFTYLALFSSSMLGLIISPNLLEIYVFWELVGMCSYLLVGFWYDRDGAAHAAQKAFVVNRVGDFGLLLGILGLFWATGSFDFQGIADGLRDGLNS